MYISNVKQTKSFQKEIVIYTLLVIPALILQNIHICESAIFLAIILYQYKILNKDKETTWPYEPCIRKITLACNLKKHQ